MEAKKSNIQNFPLNKDSVIIIAETINDSRLEKVGLIPGFAAYRLLKVGQSDGKTVYRLYSSLPCQWVGELTAVERTNLNSMSFSKYNIDLERNFLITED